MNNSMVFYVKFLGPTNTLGARMAVRSYDLLHKEIKIKYIPYDYTAQTGTDQIFNLLMVKGFKVIGMNTRNPEIDIIMVEWNFELLQDFYS